GDRFVQWQIVEARHAHELGNTIDFGRAGAALAGLAIPATGQIIGLFGLDLVKRIEHDHAFADFGSVVAELALVCIAAPDFESSGVHVQKSYMVKKLHRYIR